MTKTDAHRLRELADRCEASPEPSRLIDAEIYASLDPAERGILDALTPEGDVGTWVPNVTASLDAALTLAGDPRTKEYGGAIAMLRWALDEMGRAGQDIEALPRFVTAAALRAITEQGR